MPKIKFSALVSGMSGKANGSVFATNNGGAYFRTGASKIKPKTAANSVRKSLFTGVSQAWKTLTAEQQTAWNNSVKSFIVKNSFGDNRTPTGYEVFTRLNNTRATYSLPLLVNPPIPRDLPAVGELNLDFPDLFQFYPNFAGTNFNQNVPTAATYFYNEEVYAGTPVLGSYVLSGQFSFGGLEQVVNWKAANKGLFAAPCSGGGIFEIDVRGSSSFFQNVALSVSGGSGSWNVITTNTPVDIREPFTVTFKLSDSDVADIQIYVNGSLCPTTNTPSGTFAVPTGTTGLRVGVSTFGLQSRVLISDVRWVETTLTQTQLEQMSAGYVIGEETAIWGFNSISSTGEVLNEVAGAIGPFYVKSGDENFKLSKAFSSNRVPLMKLTVSSEGMAGVNLNIYATAPVSYGVGEKASNFRLIASVPWLEETEFNISQAWREKFKAYSINGYMNFYVTVFDTETGVIPSTQIRPPKRPRFKAGAEMGTAVN